MAGSPKSGFFLFSVLEDSNWPHSYPLTTLDKMSFCSYVTASAADLIPLFKDLETLAQVQRWSGDFQFPKAGSSCASFSHAIWESLKTWFASLLTNFPSQLTSFLGDLGESQNFNTATSQVDAPQTTAGSSPEERLKRPKETRRRRGSGGRRAKTLFFLTEKKMLLIPTSCFDVHDAS